MNTTAFDLRDGLGPLRLTLQRGRVGDNCPTRFTAAQWLHYLEQGDVFDDNHRPLSAADIRPAGTVYCYFEPAAEAPVPFEMGVLHQDERLIAVDKPHFLASIPRGQHVRQTALVRLRAMTGIADLVPLHRLDRMTAGVLLFVTELQWRRAYHDLFQSGAVTKTYEARAAYRAELDFPCVVRTRIVKEHGVMTARHEPGEPNSETHIELIDHDGASGWYRLRPITGKTHQLRLHMASLGLPIDGDNYYPEYRPRRVESFDQPLKLLAKSIEFIDPIDRQLRHFTSEREL